MRRIAVAKCCRLPGILAPTFIEDVSPARHGANLWAPFMHDLIRSAPDSQRSPTSSMPPIDVRDHDALVAALLPAVREAGRLEMAHFTQGVQFQQKADHSPVTDADREGKGVGFMKPAHKQSPANSPGVRMER